MESGVIRAEGELVVFTENHAPKSPSAPAAVLNRHPSNGTIEPRFPDGKNYKTWEAEKLEQEYVS